jgi:hypothetical protein
MTTERLKLSGNALTVCSTQRDDIVREDANPFLDRLRNPGGELIELLDSLGHTANGADGARRGALHRVNHEAISLVALAICAASALTSWTTTAKPRPASPAQMLLTGSCRWAPGCCGRIGERTYLSRRAPKRLHQWGELDRCARSTCRRWAGDRQRGRVTDRQAAEPSADVARASETIARLKALARLVPPRSVRVAAGFLTHVKAGLTRFLCSMGRDISDFWPACRLWRPGR